MAFLIPNLAKPQNDNGGNYTDVAKTTSVWGYGTDLNSRSNNIAPTILPLSQGNLLRCIMQRTNGVNHGSGSTTTSSISAPTGLTYSKLLRIQKLN